MAATAARSPVRYPIVVAQNVTAGYVTVANSCTGLAAKVFGGSDQLAYEWTSYGDGPVVGSTPSC